MSQIKDLLKQISDTVSNDDLPKISGFLDSIGRQVVTLISSNQGNRTESESWKGKFQESEAKVAELQGKVDSLSGSTAEIERLKTVEAEFNTYKERENAAKIAKWEEKAKDFDIPETDPRYTQIEKLKTRFKFENVTASDAEANLNLFETLEDAGVFEVKKSDRNDSKAGAGSGGMVNPFLKGSINLMAQVNLKREDPALYSKLKEEANRS